MADSQVTSQTPATKQVTSQTPEKKKKNPKRVVAGKALARKRKEAREKSAELQDRLISALAEARRAGSKAMVINW